MEELNGILWEERDLLEDLLFALHTERWVRSTGRSRWLLRAADQVYRASDRLRTTEVLRAVAADAAAAKWGIPVAAPLSQLAERAGEPWRTIFLDQRARLSAVAGDLARVADRGGVPTPDSNALRAHICELIDRLQDELADTGAVVGPGSPARSEPVEDELALAVYEHSRYAVPTTVPSSLAAYLA